MERELKAILDQHSGINVGARADGTFNPYLHRQFANAKRERESVIQGNPISVERNGRAYVYTLDDGTRQEAYCPPHHYQWERTPGV